MEQGLRVASDQSWSALTACRTVDVRPVRNRRCQPSSVNYQLKFDALLGADAGVVVVFDLGHFGD